MNFKFWHRKREEEPEEYVPLLEYCEKEGHVVLASQYVGGMCVRFAEGGHIGFRTPMVYQFVMGQKYKFMTVRGARTPEWLDGDLFHIQWVKE